MKQFSRFVVFLFLIGVFSPVLYGAVEIVKFDDPKKEALYLELIDELRCLVCQNQALSDSNADLAVDLRRRTRELVEDGKSRSEIIDYMVTRYGEFVLYRPPLNTNTIILWFAPILLFVIVLGVVIRRKLAAKSAVTTEYAASDYSKAKSLLSDNHSSD